MINFTISEMINSEIAKRNKINNFPNINALDNILNLIVCCLQPIRNLIGKPMIITSGYRCPELNSLVYGNKKSHHLIGCAADFVIKDMKASEIIAVIKNSKIKYNQLINEYNKWVHISYLKNNNKMQILSIF